MSIIIPAFRAGATLPAVLGAIADLAGDKAVEVILVDSSGDGSAETIRARYGWVRVHALAARTLPGRARNLGVTLARGELLVFLDADAIPQPGWLGALLAELADDVDVVAGSVLNGTPESLVGTAAWLLEFSEWLPGRTTGPLHGATCNLLIRRSAFEAAGRFREDLFPGEDTILTFPFAVAGRLAFAARAGVYHRNRTEFRDFMHHQRRLGACFVDVCRAVPFPHRAFARLPLAPLSGILRIAALARRLNGNPDERSAALRASPALLAGLLAWTLGVLTRM